MIRVLMAYLVKQNLRKIHLFLVFAIAPSFSSAATTDEEISYLLSVLTTDGCSFVSNDISYSGREFEQHLRSKLRLNDDLIASADDYIEKIATRSAVSGQPYVAVCDGKLKITKEWFGELLTAYRRNH